MVLVKICGITERRDAFAAVDAGADMLGFNFHEPSPRFVATPVVRAIVRSLPPAVATVGVFVGGPAARLKAVARACGLAMVQVHGGLPAGLLKALSPFPVIHAVNVGGRRDFAAARRSRAPLFLLDARVKGLHGGTGVRLDPRLVRRARLEVPFLLAGGLGPDNVARAVRVARPWGVDACSGVEERPGRKDRAKLRRFVRAAKAS